MKIRLLVYFPYPTGLCEIDSVDVSDYSAEEVNMITDQLVKKHGQETEFLIKRSRREA